LGFQLSSFGFSLSTFSFQLSSFSGFVQRKYKRLMNKIAPALIAQSW
jgi:hypothetical protein